ncbi:hypothetical protein FAZ69_20065 [Trinickia terrae]|uniref:GNAT family N-acetyltransferase n=1 Tax=Trinickia terrae TaxID=2571161 RepID=A0A4U1I1A4_9BURK|nr:hypothetical protein [Trinickia terrae]TKC86922.1 hypothetical protein FAZ69_20065 [Trinickia terrae]
MNSVNVSRARLYHKCSLYGCDLVIREAEPGDASAISALFDKTYRGEYFVSDTTVEAIRRDIETPHRCFWLIALLEGEAAPIGCLLARIDAQHRLAKLANAVVLMSVAMRVIRRARKQKLIEEADNINPSMSEKSSIADLMVQLATDHITRVNGVVDVVYAMTRTANAAPGRLGKTIGFKQAGVLPNAIRIQDFEHLNLEVMVTPRALETRRRCTRVFSRLAPMYALVAQSFGLEIPQVVECVKPPLTSPLSMSEIQDAAKIAQKYAERQRTGHLKLNFSLFLFPNLLLSCESVGAEIFVYHNSRSGQAIIVDYWFDNANACTVLQAAARLLDRLGATYIEMLISAHDCALQQQAYTARYLPTAYFPAASLAHDGSREDYFVFSRTFRLIDFSQSAISEENRRFLKEYMKAYQALYVPLGAMEGAA